MYATVPTLSINEHCEDKCGPHVLPRKIGGTVVGEVPDAPYLCRDGMVAHDFGEAEVRKLQMCTQMIVWIATG